MIERRKSHRTTYRKGHSWNYTNYDVLPEIDFEAVEKVTDLKLTEENRYFIEEALAHYICQTRSFANFPLADVRKGRLRAVVKACSLLESFLEWDACGTLKEEEYDPVTMFLYKYATPGVDCYEGKSELNGLPQLLVKEEQSFPNQLDIMRGKACDLNNNPKVNLDGKTVADYLSLCRKKAQESLELKGQAGHPEDPHPIQRCL